MHHIAIIATLFKDQGQAMAKHEVNLTLHTKLVQRKDVEIEIRKDDAKLGELLISQGSIDWKPRGAQHKLKLSWTQFAELMAEKGKRVND